MRWLAMRSAPEFVWEKRFVTDDRLGCAAWALFLARLGQPGYSDDVRTVRIQKRQQPAVLHQSRDDVAAVVSIDQRTGNASVEFNPSFVWAAVGSPVTDLGK